MLSDLVARRLVQLRKGAGLSREQFAKRCQQLGTEDVTPAVLANIETGRRDADTGTRRRRITVDELLVFALVLDIPPVWLLTDPTSSQRLPVADGVEPDSWEAILWITGQQPLNDPEATGPNASSGDWLDAEIPLSLIYRVAASIKMWRREHWNRSMVRFVPNANAVDEAESDETERRFLRGISPALKALRGRNFPLPALPADVLKRATELGIALPGNDEELS